MFCHDLHLKVISGEWRFALLAFQPIPSHFYQLLLLPARNPMLMLLFSWRNICCFWIIIIAGQKPEFPFLRIFWHLKERSLYSKLKHKKTHWNFLWKEHTKNFNRRPLKFFIVTISKYAVQEMKTHFNEVKIKVVFWMNNLIHLDIQINMFDYVQT